MELWFAANQALRLVRLITVVTKVRPVFLKHYTLGLNSQRIQKQIKLGRFLSLISKPILFLSLK
jgi:hypothetical protein